MNLNLKNKIALVSGSSKGIGKAISYVLLSEGAIVYVTGREEKTLNKTYKEFQQKFKGKVYKFKGDLTNTATIKRLIKVIITKHKKLDIVVANIGSGKSKVGWDVEDEIWLQTFEINLFSAVKLSREALKIMTKQKSGDIVFISSIAGCEAIPAPIPYSSAKSALLSYVKNTSNLVANLGVRLNCVSPGNIYFEGGTWDNKLKENKTAIESYLKNSVPMQRLGKPEEIAAAVCFLVSEKSSFITGANLVIDGGQIKKII